MKKIIIFDDSSRQDRNFSEALTKHNDIEISNDKSDFSKCEIVFLHTGDANSFDNLQINNKNDIILIKFSGGGLKNEILDNSEGWKLKAQIESPSQINNVLNIINKQVFTKEDVEMILNFDSKLETNDQPFKTANHFHADNTLDAAQIKAQDYVKSLMNSKA